MARVDGDVDPAGYQGGVRDEDRSDLFLNCDVALPGGPRGHEVRLDPPHTRRLARDATAA